VPQKKPIEYYEIKPAGMRGQGVEAVRVKGYGRGIGKVLAINDDALVGQVYFEIHPDQLKKNGQISVELYGDVKLGLSDCAKNGTLLSTTTVGTETLMNFNVESKTPGDEQSVFWWTIFPFESYNDVFRELHVECHPRSTGAIMAAAEYAIHDPFGLRSNWSSIWYPNEGQNSKGYLQYCIRIRVHSPYDVYPTPAPNVSPVTEAPTDTTDTNEPTASPVQASLTKQSNLAEPAASSASTSTAGDHNLRGLRQEEEEEEEQQQFAERKASESMHERAQKEGLPYDTYIDTKIKIKGNRNLRNFGKIWHDEKDDVADIYSNQAVETKTAYQEHKKITVRTFLCSDAGRTNDQGTIVASRVFYGTAIREYGIGQVFRVCVAPDEEFAEEYSVVAFESVECKNEGQARTIIWNKVAVDEYTTVDDKTLNYVNLETGDELTIANTVAFGTIVTTGFIQLGEEQTKCSGTVHIRHIDDYRRNRNLDEDEKGWYENSDERKERQAVTSVFEKTINLSMPRLVAPVEEEDTDKGQWKINVFLISTIAAVCVCVLCCGWKAVKLCAERTVATG
jgi:hypothetical protein